MFFEIFSAHRRGIKAGEGKFRMKIYSDKTAPGYIPDKNEIQGRASKNPKSVSDKNAKVVLTGDELELTGKKVTDMSSARATGTGHTSSVEFDVSQVPMMQQKLAFVNNYIMNNPAEALTAQANMNPDTVARLIG